MDKDLLVRFFEGNTSLQEEMQIREWMEMSPENRQAFFKERKMFDAMTLLAEEEDKSRTYRLSVLKRGWIRKLVEMAAVVAITIGITVFYQQSSNKQQMTAMQKIMVPVGAKNQPGTVRWNNSMAQFAYQD